MKRTVLIVLLSLLSLPASHARKHNHLLVGVNIMPAVRLNDQFKFDILKISHVSGLQIYYGGKKVFFNTGIQYLHLAEQHRPHQQNYQRDITSLIGGPFDSTILETKSCVRTHLIGIPFIVSCVFGKQKTALICDAGVEINYLLGRNVKTKTTYVDGTEKTTSRSTYPMKNHFYFAPVMRVGLQRRIGKKIAAMIQPEIGFYFARNDVDFWVTGLRFTILNFIR